MTLDATFAAGNGGGAFRIGLLATAFGFGLRHGIDWDHIAAITDVAGSQESRKRSMFLATLYIVGHAAVVLVLGVVAIAFAEQLPTSVDIAMERVVGATLVALGVYVFVALVRHGRNFRMRSRWMLVFAGVRRLGSRFSGRTGQREVVIEHEHEHEHEHAPGDVDQELHAHLHAHVHEHVRSGVPAAAATTTVAAPHRHRHRHVVTMPDDPFVQYSGRTAVGVGVIHGIGAETPTQILIFLAAAGAAGTGVGIVMLVCFVLGLLISNTAIALAATTGYLGASRNFPVYVAVSVLTATFSLVLGTLFLLGQGGVLPEFFSS